MNYAEQEKRIAHRITIDPITDIPPRTKMDEQVARELQIMREDMANRYREDQMRNRPKQEESDCGSHVTQSMRDMLEQSGMVSLEIEQRRAQQSKIVYDYPKTTTSDDDNSVVSIFTIIGFIWVVVTLYKWIF